MNTSVPSTISENRPQLALPLSITLAMGVLYTAIDLLQLPEPLLSIIAFSPGVISLISLRAAGFTRAELYLRLARISRPGLAILGAVTVLLLPILSSSSTWIGWRWLPALVYAPASGIAQELYFRSALLPGLERAFNPRKMVALLAHAVIFLGFHLRTFLSLPALPIAVLVAGVLFLAGCGWGWQVQRDRTVIWAMLQHSLFLVLMSLFDWA